MALKRKTSARAERTYILPVDIQPLAEGGYLAVCDALQGCHAEGVSMAEALDNLQDVAKNLIELRLLDGIGIPRELEIPESPKTVHSRMLVTVGL